VGDADIILPGFLVICSLLQNIKTWFTIYDYKVNIAQKIRLFVSHEILGFNSLIDFPEWPATSPTDVHV
jgi:hypothetical protein